jgi:hypothetical protein
MLEVLIEALVACLLSFVAWELLRASSRHPKLDGDLSVVVDLGMGLATVAAVVVWFVIVLQLTFKQTCSQCLRHPRALGLAA